MANDTCKSSIYACRLRVARLNSGGQPLDGEDNLYVSDALISITSTPEIEEGDEFVQKNGCGDICASAKADDHIKRVTLKMELCQLDAELLEILTGGSVLTSGGDTVGYVLPPSDASVGKVSVEAWSKAYEGSQQAADGADALYYHWVWPSTTWVPGEHTLENGVLIVPVTGSGTENSGFGDGPGDDMPGEIDGAEAFFLDTEIPDAVCGYQELAQGGSSV